jgi:trimethylamine--corrinoid protein Co-methyltransferase
VQTGHEKTLTALTAALAGTNLIYGLGMIESGVTFDYAQLVIDNEMARMVKQVVGGVRVDDESLAVDDIAAVGSSGDFLSLDATMRHMRETSQPELIDRRVREDWERRGATDMYQRAMEKAKELLADHHPEPLPDDVLRQVRGIVDKADRERAPKV